ncbi:MAG: hypothetical protein ACI9SP_004195 [Arenicella sp.]|jgi:hypothetical protein
MKIGWNVSNRGGKSGYWQIFQRKVEALQTFLFVRRVMQRSLLTIKTWDHRLLLDTTYKIKDIAMKIPFRKLLLTGFLSLSVVLLTACNTSSSTISESSVGQSANYTAGVPSNTYDCPADPKWITNPSLPTEVKKSAPNGSSNFCDFYQFSTQTYLYLMSPSTENPELRNFQVDANYPLLEFNSAGTPANSCDDVRDVQTLRTALQKSVSPIGTGQAGGGSSIYDQNKNVVYYDVRFNKSLCNMSANAVELASSNITNFIPGTTELKFAWKVLANDEILNTSYVTVPQNIGGQVKILGLVGMHIAVATHDHPEFVWATYEHNTNTPNCDAQGKQADTNWSFASASCTNKLPLSADKTDAECKFNQPTVKNGPATGTATNICAVYPFGTASGDRDAGENLANIASQNASIYQSLKATHAAPSMQILNNYFNVGAIWVSNTDLNSGGIGVPNERGSLRLANTVAETDFQHVNLNYTGSSGEFASNCFGCHNFTGKDQPLNNNITTQKLSHSFIDVITGQGKAADVNATSQIVSNSQAQTICGGDPSAKPGSSENKGTCKNTRSYLSWNGEWTNKNTSTGSVCGCVSE